MKYIVALLILLLLPIAVFSQDDFILEEFEPLPNKIKNIKGTQYSIYQQDTTKEDFSEYNFDKDGNLTDWEIFPYYTGEKLKYDTLGRIIELEGLYGESLANGIISYSYPSQNEIVEIEDRITYYRYKRTTITFDQNGRISQKQRYDSTFKQEYQSDTVYTMIQNYIYDEKGSLLEKKDSVEANKLVYMYHIKYSYNQNKVIHQEVVYYRDDATPAFYNRETKDFFYVLTGKFKGKLEKDIEFITSPQDTIQLENYYTYKMLPNNIIVQDRKHFNNETLMRHEKYYYENNILIKIEMYNVSREHNTSSNLTQWTEYTYSFHPKK